MTNDENSGLIGAFDLATEIARFPPGDQGGGRRSEILVKTDGLRVVLVTMRAGAALHEHIAPGPITIHALQGAFAVLVDGAEQACPAGTIIAIAQGVRHAVRAVADGAFLLSIGGSGADRA